MPPTRCLLAADLHYTRRHFFCSFFSSKALICVIMPPVNRSSSVRALCSQLGYNETQDKDSPRHFTHLATTLRQFRRINKVYDIPTCAFEFCKRAERDRSFFTSSREAKTRGWPVLPIDKDRYGAPHALVLFLY
jgi:hypothetical protein